MIENSIRLSYFEIFEYKRYCMIFWCSYEPFTVNPIGKIPIWVIWWGNFLIFKVQPILTTVICKKKKNHSKFLLLHIIPIDTIFMNRSHESHFGIRWASFIDNKHLVARNRNSFITVSSSHAFNQIRICATTIVDF